MTANKRAAICATNGIFRSGGAPIRRYHTRSLPTLHPERLYVSCEYDTNWRWTRNSAHHNELIYELNSQLARHHVICAGVARMWEIDPPQPGIIRTIWDVLACDEDTILPRPASTLLSHCSLAGINSALTHAWHAPHPNAVPPLTESIPYDKFADPHKYMFTLPLKRRSEETWQEALNRKTGKIRAACDTYPLWEGFKRPSLGRIFTDYRSELLFYAYTRYPIPPWYSHIDTMDALGLTTRTHKKNNNTTEKDVA